MKHHPRPEMLSSQITLQNRLVSLLIQMSSGDNQGVPPYVDNSGQCFTEFGCRSLYNDKFHILSKDIALCAITLSNKRISGVKQYQNSTIRKCYGICGDRGQCLEFF
ncbi:hypothetical protein KL86DPRO_40077 [uncultured delta proteobacterium]|uniref:Uncharacterized protein n=1 Tax=uncultured delta proteobacterium TaxID=34034 RepID=A0A212K9M4_9DELT|nr:hypothetical protein KL86DPRO_40077 [uncultured delta proteobacterium]